MILSLEGWPTKAKEAPSPHEVRLTPLETNPVFLCLDEKVHFEPDNFEPHNSLQLNLTNIRGLCSHFVECESFLESHAYFCPTTKSIEKKREKINIHTIS